MLESMYDLCWPGNGARSGTIVGTVIAPAVMAAVFARLEGTSRGHPLQADRNIMLNIW